MAPASCAATNPTVFADRGHFTEHRVRKSGTDNRAADLCWNMREHVTPPTMTECCTTEADDGIEVCTADRLEDGDEDVERRCGRTGVHQELQTSVARREPGCGYAGADDRCDECCRADELCEERTKLH